MHSSSRVPDIYPLDRFIADCRDVAAGCADPADCVQAIAPLMCRLVESAPDFLTPGHHRSDPVHYARNAIHIAPDRQMSLYALVWLPGQWTPVHDHGSWGVVGVVKGVLEERAYMCADGEITRNDGIRLKRGGMVLLPPGAVTTFVPNPDHIHMTGVAADRETVVSLHLYGRTMNSFHIYDVNAGTRKLIDVPHQES
jgi:predicted metal-dependent enzyme (double-stranded beta helix superfamily)